jgi:hypothetical protein
MRHLPQGDVITVTRPGEAMFRRAAFPIWRVTRNGQDIPQSGPIIRFNAGPGLYRIERRLIWQEVAGTAMSIVAMVLLCVVGLSGYRWPRRGKDDGTTGRRVFPWQPSRERPLPPSVAGPTAT